MSVAGSENWNQSSPHGAVKSITKRGAFTHECICFKSRTLK